MERLEMTHLVNRYDILVLQLQVGGSLGVTLGYSGGGWEGRLKRA